MMCENPSAAACPYDVGDILTTSSDKDPVVRWPGTEWTQIKDCFLLASGEKHAAGSTGGEETHALTESEGPRHVHTWVGWASTYDPNGQYSGLGASKSNAWQTVSGGEVSYDGGSGLNFAGKGEPHNNMPPYLAVYVWRRTK